MWWNRNNMYNISQYREVGFEVGKGSKKTQDKDLLLQSKEELNLNPLMGAGGRNGAKDWGRFGIWNYIFSA